MKTLPVFRAAGALLLAVLFLNDAHSAEIRLKSGRTFEGTIKHITPQTVVVETGNQVLFLSSDLVDMSAKDWLATAQTAFERDNVENAAILCQHALKKSKDLEEARELMRKIEEKRIQKTRETAIRAAQALAERQKALAAPPAQETTVTSTSAEVAPPAGENPIEGAASTPSGAEAPSTSTGLTSAGLAAAETGTPAPGSLGAGFRLEGPGPVPTPSAGGGSGGGSQSIAGVLPPGFGALAGLQMAAAAFAQAKGQAKVPPAPKKDATGAAKADSEIKAGAATPVPAFNIPADTPRDKPLVYADGKALVQSSIASTPSTPSIPSTSSTPAGGKNPMTADLGGGVKMDLGWVPERGGEGGFWAGKYEVTQEQYEAVTGKNPSGFKGAKNPVEMVSWNDAKAFCASLSKKTGRSCGLPTEKQWEFACRAGSTGDYCFGSDEGQLGEYAWYDKNSGNQTHPVGQKKPNAFGLYDVHGNVEEWCEDAVEGGSRVLRGGSWYYDPHYCRASFRSGYTSPCAYYFGFRVVCGGSSSR